MTEDKFDDLRCLQEQHAEWSEKNFGEQPYEWTLLGAQEELGELTHSELKQLQGIREAEDDVGELATKDSVGDIVMYLLDFCNRKDIDFAECVDIAATEVLDREWNSEPEER